MEIRLATYRDIDRVISFFEENLSSDNDAIYSEEFFCPLGVRAAIRRNQLIVAVEDSAIIAAVRFYRRKTKKVTSLYQFAIGISYRGKGLLKKMLELICDTEIVALCPKTSSFNAYYQKTGWILKESDGSYNHWYLPSRSVQNGW